MSPQAGRQSVGFGESVGPECGRVSKDKQRGFDERIELISNGKVALRIRQGHAAAYAGHWSEAPPRLAISHIQ